MIPTVLVFLHRLAVIDWWPPWLIYVWPSSYMLPSEDSPTSLSAYVTIGFSSILNALLYALIALAILRLIQGKP